MIAAAMRAGIQSFAIHDKDAAGPKSFLNERPNSLGDVTHEMVKGPLYNSDDLGAIFIFAVS